MAFPKATPSKATLDSICTILCAYRVWGKESVGWSLLHETLPQLTPVNYVGEEKYCTTLDTYLSRQIGVKMGRISAVKHNDTHNSDTPNTLVHTFLSLGIPQSAIHPTSPKSTNAANDPKPVCSHVRITCSASNLSGCIIWT